MFETALGRRQGTLWTCMSDVRYYTSDMMYKCYRVLTADIHFCSSFLVELLAGSI